MSGGTFSILPAPFVLADGRGGAEPLRGQIEFRLAHAALPEDSGVTVTGPVVVDLDAEGRVPDGTVLPAWEGATCLVVPRVRIGEHGRDLRLVPFSVPAEPGTVVALADHVTLRRDPSAGTVYVRGPRGEFLEEDRHLFEAARAEAVGAAHDAAAAAGEAHVAMQVTVARVEDAEDAAVEAADSAARADAARTGAEAAAQSAVSVVGGADDARVAAEAAAGAASSSATEAGEARDGAAAHESRVEALAEEASGSAVDAEAAAEAAAGSATAAGASASAAETHAGEASASATAAHGHAQTAEGAAGAAEAAAGRAETAEESAQRAADAADGSAAAAAAEHSALTAAIAAGDYRGVGIEAVENEPGGDTATVRYTDGNTSALPLPPGPPPLAEWDGPHLVVGGQRSPDLTGPPSLVPGPPGAVPTAADYAIVGPGRPDVPASTGDLVTASTPIGATYTSTDGAGVGAFVWRKRPDGSWQVVDGDTGWRDITGEVEYEDTPLNPWTLSYRLRDTGMTVMLRTTWLGGLGAPSIPSGTILWTPPAALEMSGSPKAPGVRNGKGVTVPVVDTQTGTPKGGIVLAYRNDSGDARFQNIALVGGSLEGRGVATLEYMHTSWPNALPGTN